MSSFDQLLASTKEIGFVEELRSGIVAVSGLPQIKLFELVLFETGEIGQVIGLHQGGVEVLLFAFDRMSVGTRAVRTGQRTSIGVGVELLGKTVNPLGVLLSSSSQIQWKESRGIDTHAPGIMARAPINQPCETGVGIVDLLVPIGRGQRELVVGDRKTGKTVFLLQAMVSQARAGSICIYSAIGKKQVEIKQLEEFIKKQGISEQTIIVATSSSEPSGLNYLNPYSAMTIAEYFRDQGKDVFIVMDDLTTHAAVYREITLIARRFPGRGAYPGDIFYTHARLMERAGNFFLKNGKTSSITCIPVAQSVMGDLAAYITTNIMSMTDGHLFFDNQLFDQGRRPAVNTGLSVTRVGLQAQTQVLRDISRQLTSFIVQYEKMKQYTHFGAEVSTQVKETLALGDQVFAFLQQFPEEIVPLSANVFFIALLWGGFWKGKNEDEMKQEMRQYVSRYHQDQQFAQLVNTTVQDSASFQELISKVNTQATQLIQATYGTNSGTPARPQ